MRDNTFRSLWIRVALSCVLVMHAIGQTAPAQKRLSPAVHNYRMFLAMPADTPLSDSTPVALRRFVRNDTDFVMTVSPIDLSVDISEMERYTWYQCEWQEFLLRYRETTYGKAILEARLAVLPIKDAGFNRFLTSQEGISLTVDLCPSRRPLDRHFFDTLITALAVNQTPVPIGIAITGTWLKTHTGDLKWLLDLERTNRIHITWINHSYHHHIPGEVDSSDTSCSGTAIDLCEEVLGLERLLIEKGLMPSVFFRFPGLVSNPELIVNVVSFGVIPVGSDAWLAKEQKAKNGSIVLVHANGNEPWGLQKFVRLLAEKRDSIRRKAWFLYDLRTSMIKALDSAATVH